MTEGGERETAESSAHLSALRAALDTLRETLARLDLSLDLPGAGSARAEAQGVTRQLDDYVVPRLDRLDAPLLVVVGGSTGAGKSTLVNSLVRQPVSPAGVLRPTTRAPVLVHHPHDEQWFGARAVLPCLPRADDAGGVAGALRLATHWRVPRGMALVDAPDLDSVVALNRDLAAQLLAAADLWLFVTSAARYADAVPWEALQGARERSTAIAVVLDRVPAGAGETVAADLARMLAEHGLGDAPLFQVAETTLDDEGLLPDPVVDELRAWLIALAADRMARDAVVRRSLAGALAALGPRLDRVCTAVTEQDAAAARRRGDVQGAYAAALAAIDRAMQDGSLLKGEVLARWQELVGTGQLMRGLEIRVGRLRDRVSARLRGRAAPAAELEVAIESGVEALVRTEADAASDRAFAAWWSSADGRGLLQGRPGDPTGPRDLSRSSGDLPDRTRHAVREWQSAVLDLVRSEGVGRRRSARLMSYGVNGLGLLVMVATFAHTGGITGLEGGVAAGTSVLGQRLLEALLGDQAVRRLAGLAREDLSARVHALLDEEADRFLDRLPPPHDAAGELRAATVAVTSTAARELPLVPTALPPTRPDETRE